MCLLKLFFEDWSFMKFPAKWQCCTELPNLSSQNIFTVWAQPPKLIPTYIFPAILYTSVCYVWPVYVFTL